MDDLRVVPEATVIVAERLEAMRARRENLRDAPRPQGFDILIGELLKHVFVSCPLRGITITCLLLEHTERTAARAKNVEQRAQRLLIVGLERSGASEHGCAEHGQSEGV